MQPDVPIIPRPAVEDPIKTRQRHDNLPAGVVPAPDGYAYHHNAQVRDESMCGLDDFGLLPGPCGHSREWFMFVEFLG
jgi:hypothetical protein